MKISKIDDMIGGWFVGNFEPSAFKTENFEVSYKKHYKGEKWDIHYHHTVTEINLLIRGKLKMQGKILEVGDIFLLEPYEIADPIFLEDCDIICVKTPSMNDKIILKNE
jgi:hypothetical protein